MKSTLRMMVLAVTLAAGSLAQASQIYDYSYTFIGSSNSPVYVVNGSFTGDPSGSNLIINLTDISASVNNVALTGSGSLFGSSWDSANQVFVSGGAVASLDGTQNNLLFIDSDYPDDPAWTNYFLLRDLNGGGATDQAWVASSETSGAQFPDTEGYSASRWSVTPQGTVPEPGSLALAAIALLGLAASRRKSQA